MHERKLMDDLMRKIEAEAHAANAQRVTRVRVRLGALSHFTEQHFHEHFEHAARGGPAAGAEVEIELGSDPTEPGAQGVVLESIEVELEQERSSVRDEPADRPRVPRAAAAHEPPDRG